MNSETLEHLLLDDALGQLAPDVSALLAAYVANDSAAHVQSQSIRQTVGLARQAVAGQARKLPPFDRGKLVLGRRRQVFTRAARFVAAGSAIAACLIAAFFIGRHQQSSTGLASVQPTPVPLAVRPPPPLTIQATAAVHDFWSTERLRALARQNAAAPHDTTAIDLANYRLFRSTGG